MLLNEVGDILSYGLLSFYMFWHVRGDADAIKPYMT
jgi:hypothetical protein